MRMVLYDSEGSNLSAAFEYVPTSNRFVVNRLSVPNYSYILALAVDTYLVPRDEYRRYNQMYCFTSAILKDEGD